MATRVLEDCCSRCGWRVAVHLPDLSRAQAALGQMIANHLNWEHGVLRAEAVSTARVQAEARAREAAVRVSSRPTPG